MLNAWISAGQLVNPQFPANTSFILDGTWKNPGCVIPVLRKIWHQISHLPSYYLHNFGGFPKPLWTYFPLCNIILSMREIPYHILVTQCITTIMVSACVFFTFHFGRIPCQYFCLFYLPAFLGWDNLRKAFHILNSKVTFVLEV